MSTIQMQLLLAIMSMEPPSTSSINPVRHQQRNERLLRQGKRPRPNKRANRHIFTNKDMKM